MQCAIVPQNGQYSALLKKNKYALKASSPTMNMSMCLAPNRLLLQVNKSKNDFKFQARVPWYEKPCENLTTVSSIAEMYDIIDSADNKKVAVDIFAGWCTSCKGAYGALCNIAHSFGNIIFLKANVDDDSKFRELLLNKGISGIPYLIVFDSNRQQVAGIPATLKQMDTIRGKLKAISEMDAENSEASDLSNDRDAAHV
nr:thioredoxin-like protein (TXN) [Polytomella parva]|mmetsp:Transcript_9024/g.17012  ORF Transcript_9024/g.17012 Transcript_9024/m.17012 type:complete len:199 (-) Transcript_9024:574-1170(-)|eukprot:CAMPEP_0175040024 /NCGR_PEP_ID=MMETSP0052_2-20121109/994_1 /TAXON_ID=51329 ORGANISM="Polytomella parva, Strain SAG 63-3" /NCGR_SAMPLE_ID=MMETSP0052_2 /ASSEMBLY_ACC=CAM_ASM_000194 /LENGTH=198 /DNA_ID=CAMNT_0016302111 /DNA_START=32 /DNA_END=628 /DNA_ORIENTATION=-